MSERTVSVELTEAELRWLQSYTADKVGYGFPARMNETFVLALSQFATDREREAKVKALYDWTENSYSNAMDDARETLVRLNKAGWDLVRMEEK
jgi:phosphoglycolate phosphatase-like HAD superfamily hydrolase